ncbi:hypothetical protein [Roseateles sp. YR242]|uniref:hypothetical protein n=1 Tax=Roseateles sp. YR242 TaxID=1855305 RepID=UPI001160714F|nr:hypothetical protein [Roseateles sp. YR242]
MWALLARDTVLKDPNTDYWPLHAWSNEPGINYQLARPGKPKSYHEGVRAAGVAAAVADPEVDVFAFQEMNKSSGAPRNDKAIFAAMTSLVKAQAYELSSLPGRKKTKAVYQFNLISVVGADMYRLMFAPNGSGISTTKIDSEQYIARYIVSKRESFSRIRFITSKAFRSALDDYGKLHSANVKWFGGQQTAFYEDIIKDHDRIRSLSKAFNAQIKHKVKWRVEAQFKNLKNFDEEPFLSWNSKRNVLEVSYWVDEEVVQWLNESKDIQGVIEAALKGVYRYSGPFEFDVPF